MDDKSSLDAAGAAAGIARALDDNPWDIIASSQLVDAIGDEAWETLVRWHDQALRSLFASHDGEEVDHAGDGFSVAFTDPRQALACAVAIQRRFAEHRRDHGFAPQVRIGVHATEASEGAGKYRGRGVHEAARIGAIAGAAEIVASARTADGVYPASEPRSVSLEGLSQPVDVVTIQWR